MSAVAVKTTVELNEKEIEEIISKFKKIIDLTQLNENYKNGIMLGNKNRHWVTKEFC